MNAWKWMPERTLGIWRHGPAWLRPFAVAVPWITVLLLLLMFHRISDSIVSPSGVLVDLPVSAESVESESTSLVTLVMQMPHGSLVFFDDARYATDDDAALAAFGEHLTDRVGKKTEGAERPTMLVIADRRVASGALMEIAAIAKRSGVGRILFSGRKAEESDE